jgi:hypothetical protein
LKRQNKFNQQDQIFTPWQKKIKHEKNPIILDIFCFPHQYSDGGSAASSRYCMETGFLGLSGIDAGRMAGKQQVEVFSDHLPASVFAADCIDGWRLALYCTPAETLYPQ